MCSRCPRVVSTEPLEARRLLTTWYVDAGSAAAAPDGTSWAAAYPGLQLALAAATSGDTIRVAGGTYKPSATADRTATFTLKSGVAVYGGYAGSASPAAPDARDPALYPATLSGDIGAPADNSDNSYHVVTASGLGDDPATLLDGAVITGGNATANPSGQRVGGGLNVQGSRLTVRNVTFANNRAADTGGGLNAFGSPVLVDHCTFTGNSAGQSGGGAFTTSAVGTYTNGPTASFADCSFSGNTAANGGAIAITSTSGGTYSSASFAGVVRCTFTSNTATTSGGALYCNYALTPAVADCTFTGNAAPNGGGLYTYYTILNLNRCTFVRNAATQSGGGMYVEAAGGSVAGCVFDGNTAGTFGGGTYQHNGKTGYVNCTFAGNSSQYYGAGMYNAAAQATLDTVTFAGNQIRSAASDYGAAVYGDAYVTAHNSIFYGNSVRNAPPIVNGTGGPSYVTYSDVQGGMTGAGNINADPRFYRNPSPGPDATWGTADDDYGDLRLLPGSLCIDAGSNAVIPAGVTTDLAGGPRTYDFPGAGTPGASTVDMGAYELTQNLGALHLTAGQTLALPAGGYSFSATQLTIDAGGTLDLADDALLIDYAGASPLAAVRSALQAGRNGGTWNGTGIVSSVARTRANHAIGYAEAADLGLTTFAGQTVDSTALLLKYTTAGDANLDGRINADDYALADRGKAKGLGIWVFGDFDYDAAVTGADYAILNASAAPPPAPAPIAAVDPLVATDPVTAAVDPTPAPAQVVAPATPAVTSPHAKPAPAKTKPTTHAPVVKPKAKPKAKSVPAPKPKPKPAPRAATSSHPISHR